MLTLGILRHAEAVRDIAGRGDFERDLTPEGEAAARRLGAWMRRHGVAPDLVLTSSAVRTQRTSELVFGAFDPEVTIVSESALYLASPRTLLARVRQLPDSVRHLVLVGHNPGLHAFATALVGSGPADLLAQVEDDLPTAAFVMLEIDAARWADVQPDTARLTDIVVPKRLES